MSIFCLSSLDADNGQWTGNVDTSWSTPGNWLLNNIANNGGIAIMATNTDAVVDIDVTLGKLEATAANDFAITRSGYVTLDVETVYQATANTLYINGVGGYRDNFFSFAANLGYIDLAAGGTVYFTNISERNGVPVYISGAGTVKAFNGPYPTFTGSSATLAGGATLNYTYNGTFSSPTNFVLQGASILQIAINNARLTGNISGGGSLTIQGVCTLSGNNSYSGGTTVNGTLIGTTNSIPATGGVLAQPGTCRFQQDFNGAYSGIISGVTGSVNKRGQGKVTLTRTNSYQGATIVNAGTLSVTGSIATSSGVTVAPGATLTGNGTVCAVTNSGTVVSGLAATDTLQVNGAFFQATSGSKVRSILSPTSASLLSITGAATLRGTLELSPTAGIYFKGLNFTVLNAAGGRVGNSRFSSFNDNLGNIWRVQYNGGLVSITSLQAFVATPVPLSTLSLNPRNVGNYYYQGTTAVFLASPDLTTVARASLAISDAEGFAESLLRLSPITEYGKIGTVYQNDVQMAVAIDKQFQTTTKKERRAQRQADLDDAVYYGIPQTGVFIQPIGIFYHQKQTANTLSATEQAPFTAYTYGAGLGCEYVFNSQFVLEGGFGYTHSNLTWTKNFGNSKWSSLYVAPFFGWFNDTASANIMVMGAFNFFNTNRRIQFPGIQRVAQSQYNSYDVLIRANSVVRWMLFQDVDWMSDSTKQWLQPEGTVNFVSIFTEGYQENGAGGVNLQVQQRTNYIVQPSFRLRFIQEFVISEFCYAPNIYVGWLANIPLDNRLISARFVEAPTNLFFNIQGGNKTNNQLILGAEFYAQRLKRFEISSNFEADILSKFEIYTVKLKFEWFF